MRHATVALTLIICGCSGSEDPEPPVTFSNQVSRLLQQHCEGCHRPEGLAPFSLVTYEDAAPRAESILDAVVSGRMPHGISMRLDSGCAEPDTFFGPRRLVQSEIDLISTWVEYGAPEGNRADLPPPLEYPTGEWLMGTPDFETPNHSSGFNLPPDLDRDIFRRFVVDPGFDTEQFITGFEALPDATTGGLGLEHVVHHVTLFVNPGAEAFQQEADFAASNPEVPGPGFEGDFAGYPVQLVGMWFPGSDPLQLPEGFGVKVSPGAALVFEVHYSPNQEVSFDQTRIGLQLESGVSELQVGLVKNTEFVIPAGDPAYEVNAESTFEDPLKLYSITPHQHQLGTYFRIEIDRPGQPTVCLADVDWDFEHQGTYQLQEAFDLPAGSRIRTSCIYDNSADNPNQFNDPPIDVDFAPTADHEMCQLTVQLSP